MRTDKIDIVNIDEQPEKAFLLATELFHTGKIFIYPTDTICGIGGNPFDERAAMRIVEIKGRDEKKQFIWLLPDIESVLNYVDISFETHIDFLSKLWPAPVTVVLQLNSRTKEIVRQGSIAIRIPRNDFCLKLLREVSRPLISTSVNTSGSEPLSQIDKIISEFSYKVDAIFSTSQSKENIFSTIIDLTTAKPKLIREGSIKFVELLENFS